MKYYDLSQGDYKKGKLTENEMWDAFNWLFSDKSLNDSSYKFILLKSIIDCIDRKSMDGSLTFDVIFDRFTSISWNLVLKYNISQKIKAAGKKATVLEQTLNSYLLSENSGVYIPMEDIDQASRKKLVSKVKQECKRYVIGALYGDMKELLYSFSKREQKIKLNPQMEDFIKKHKNIIESLNYYKWASFYEKVNSEEVAKKIADLINTGFKKRKNESIYRAVLAYEFEQDSPETDENTLEFLFIADNIAASPDIDKDSIEEELFQDYDCMRNYLDNPIALITKLKREKGIMV